MNEWMVIVPGISLLLLLFLLWKEWHRKNRNRLAWRLLANSFAVISLAYMALPLPYDRPVFATDNMPTKMGGDSIHHTGIENEAILLTEGFTADSIRHFTRQYKKAVPIFTLDERLKEAGKYDAALICDTDSISAHSFSVLHVFGHGLSPEELSVLKGQPIRFHPAKITTGITSIHWPLRVKSGERLSVQGNFHNTGASGKKLILTAFNTVLDSIITDGSSEQAFSLSALPKQAGRSVYMLVVLNGKDTLAKEPVPIEVETAIPLKILLLASSPDFENKFLKNWLAQQGYAVAARTAISKERHSKEFMNIPAFSIDRITSPVLDRFDMVVADAAELSLINREELHTIQSYVLENRLGLIIHADSLIAHAAFYAGRFPLLSMGPAKQPLSGLRLIDSSSKLPAGMESTFSIQVQNGTQPLVKDKQGRVFVSMALYGAGKLLLSTLPDTYQWALSGDQQGYENFWSALFNNAAPKKTGIEKWTVSPAFPRIHEPVNLWLTTGRPGIPQVQVEGVTVSPANHAELPFTWQGTFWPSKKGWQATPQADGGIYYWYAYGNEDWKNIATADRITQTFKYQQENLHTGNGQPSQIPDRTGVNKIWFFLLFLFCCGYVWLENKYHPPVNKPLENQ